MEHKIIHRDINSMIFAEYNPRQLTKDQYKHLKDSISRFGLVDPIIVNSNKDRKNVIVGGHQRVRVAMDMEIEYVPVIEIDLTYEKERELNVRLNKNSGEWNFDMLANNFEIDELLGWGFENYELGVGKSPDIDIDDMWEGMPEYENDNQTPYKTIHLHFRNEDDIKEFAEIVKQKLTKDTRSMWYPKLEKEIFKDKEYKDAT